MDNMGQQERDHYFNQRDVSKSKIEGATNNHRSILYGLFQNSEKNGKSG